MEKIYRVEFMHYANIFNTAISNDADNFDNYSSIEIGKEPFLVRESELEKYKMYGGGFRSVEFVGNLII